MAPTQLPAHANFYQVKDLPADRIPAPAVRTADPVAQKMVRVFRGMARARLLELQEGIYMCLNYNEKHPVVPFWPVGGTADAAAALLLAAINTALAMQKPR
jgi:hypothetical protein